MSDGEFFLVLFTVTPLRNKYRYSGNVTHTSYTVHTIDTEVMSIAASIAQMEHYLNLAKAEDAKLQKGTRSSAAKVRSALLEMGKECSARKAALEAGKAIPVKKRAPKVAEAAEAKESKESKSD